MIMMLIGLADTRVDRAAAYAQEAVERVRQRRTAPLQDTVFDFATMLRLADRAREFVGITLTNAGGRRAQREFVGSWIEAFVESLWQERVADPLDVTSVATLSVRVAESDWRVLRSKRGWQRLRDGRVFPTALELLLHLRAADPPARPGHA